MVHSSRGARTRNPGPHRRRAEAPVSSQITTDRLVLEAATEKCKSKRRECSTSPPHPAGLRIRDRMHTTRNLEAYPSSSRPSSLFAFWSEKLSYANPSKTPQSSFVEPLPHSLCCATYALATTAPLLCLAPRQQFGQRTQPDRRRLPRRPCAQRIWSRKQVTGGV